MSEGMFGPYRLDELIGQGGMGEVYRAYDTVRGRPVAVKLLRRDLAADTDFQARFRRESSLAARLSAPHVIPIHDYGDVDGRLFIDMQLVKGIDLAALLAERGPLPPADAVRIIEQVATALDAAHADGLEHRDVKPSNVLLTGKDRDFAYLVDFGLARSLTGDSAAHTATGATVGTVGYMAPERFLDGAPDHRADIYSLACVLYETLTASKPFTGNDLPSVMYGHLTLPPPLPSVARPGVPIAFDAVIARGMAKAPERRFGTARELAEAARSALTTADPTHPTDVHSRPVLTPDPPARPRRRIGRGVQIFFALAGVIVILVFAGAWMMGWIDGRIDRRLGAAGPTSASITATLNIGSNPSLPRISPDGSRVYVITDVGISTIDTRTNAVGTVPLPERTRSGSFANTAISPDGTRLYASTTSPDRTAEVIAVIDTATLATITYLPVGPPGSAVWSLEISPNGATLYVSVVPHVHPERSTLKVMDAGTGAVTKELALGAGIHGFTILPPGTRGYATQTVDASTHTLNAVDLVAGIVGPPLPVGRNPFSTVESRDRATAYAAVDGGISVLDTINGALVRTIPVTPAPRVLALAPDQRTLVFTGPDGISRLDLASGAVIATIPHAFGAGYGDIALTPDGRRAYVADESAAAVLVIDLPA